MHKWIWLYRIMSVLLFTVAVFIFWLMWSTTKLQLPLVILFPGVMVALGVSVTMLTLSRYLGKWTHLRTLSFRRIFGIKPVAYIPGEDTLFSVGQSAVNWVLQNRALTLNELYEQRISLRQQGHNLDSVSKRSEWQKMVDQLNQKITEAEAAFYDARDVAVLRKYMVFRSYKNYLSDERVLHHLDRRKPSYLYTKSALMLDLDNATGRRLNFL